MIDLSTYIPTLQSEVERLAATQTQEDRRRIRAGMRDLQGVMHEKSKVGRLID